MYPVGTVIGNRYQIQSFLGGGNFGEVYRALDANQGVVVALKLLKVVVNPAQPWAEAQILEHLQSPYILRVRNADVIAGRMVLSTDLATNGTAADKMKPIGVDPKTAVRWTRHACRGAARTHQANLLHRDIKPENLFLTSDNAVLLGDFGIAAVMDPTGHAPWGGTPQTMAPEVAAAGIGPVLSTSVRSDVYSLGATCYALLAGGFGHDDPDCTTKLLAGPPTPLRDRAPHVSLALAQRVEKAMARDPLDRYPDPETFDAALGNLPEPDRYWVRTDEHAPAHAMCFRGSRPGHADCTICAFPVGTRFEIIGQKWPSGHVIHAVGAGAFAPSQLSRRMRVGMSAL